MNKEIIETIFKIFVAVIWPWYLMDNMTEIVGPYIQMKKFGILNEPLYNAKIK